MKILTIDPGTEWSAWVVFDTGKNRLVSFGLEDNKTLINRIDNGHFVWGIELNQTGSFLDLLVIEMVKSYGNALGDSILETCVWIGRFLQKWGDSRFELIPRKTIVTQICNNPRANDSNVRQALIDRWGGKDMAIGNKSNPGPLYAVKNDIWSALAIAHAFAEIETENKRKLERGLK